MGINPGKVNINMGSYCISHLLEANRIFLVGHFACEMNRRNSRYGLAAVPGEAGQGTAVLVEREEYWNGRSAFLQEPDAFLLT